MTHAAIQTTGDQRSDAEAPWLLAVLFSGPHQRFQPIASFVLGLLGVTAFAIVTSAATGLYVSSISRDHFSIANQIIATVPMAGAYVTVLFSLHLIGSVNLPLTVRVAMVYATLYLSLSAILGSFELPAKSLYVLYGAPFCLGSFLQRSVGRWNMVAWKQEKNPRSVITTRSLLDFTAATALTMCLVPPLGNAPPSAYVCFLPAACFCALIGMHVWARLTALSSDSSDIASGWGLWMAGNISLACLIWLVLAIVVDQTTLRLFGFFSAIAIVVAAHLWTEIPVRWLKACGWSLVRQ